MTCKRTTYKEKRSAFILPIGRLYGQNCCLLSPRMFLPVLRFSSSAKTSVSNFQFGLDRRTLWKSSHGWWGISLYLKQSNLFIRCVECVKTARFLSNPVTFSVSTTSFIWLANRKKTFGNGHTCCSLNFMLVTITCCERWLWLVWNTHIVSTHFIIIAPRILLRCLFAVNQMLCRIGNLHTACTLRWNKRLYCKHRSLTSNVGSRDLFIKLNFT